MATNTAENIVASIDAFVCAQAPLASEVTFSYESTLDATAAPYKVTVLSVYDGYNAEPIATRSDLHSEGVVKMEEYLGTTLPLILSSKYVLNLPIENGAGKFGVALRNSEDRIDRRAPTIGVTEDEPLYSETL